MDGRLPSLFGRGSRELDPFSTLQREVSRMFEEFGRGFSSMQGAIALTPRIDVKETERALEICAELPGVDEKDVDVQLTEDGLTIQGEKKLEKTSENEGWHVMERSYGSFMRRVPLGFQVDPGQVEASFEKGVLKITVPKPEQAQKGPAKIQIKSGEGGGSAGPKAS